MESLEKMSRKSIASDAGVEQERPAEFEFHQERWAQQALNYRKRLIKQIFDRNSGLTAEDRMHEEALRDNADFEKRKHGEFKEWQKNLQVVINRLKEKRNNPESAEIRPLLLIMGGGMKGSYGAGQVIGLNEAGIPADTFDVIVGISAGAATAAYYAAGPEQTRRGSSIFYEECTSKEFIDRKRIIKELALSKLMSTAFLTEDKMAHGPKKLDESAVRRSRAEVYFGVTRLPEKHQEPEDEFINAKTAQPGILPAMRASMTVPLVAGNIPPVNGIEYVDGSFDPLPIDSIIEAFNPTDILVLPNTPFDRLDTFQPTRSERAQALMARVLKNVPGGSLRSLDQMERMMYLFERLRKSLESIKKKQGINIGIMWPPGQQLGNWTQDAGEMKAAVLESARSVIEQFGEEQPHEISLYESPKEGEQLEKLAA